MRVTTGACAPAKLASLQVWKQSLDCGHDVIGSSVRPSPVFLLLNLVLLACLLILPYRFAIATPFVESQMVFDGVQLGGGFDVERRTVELTAQSQSSGISQQVKFSPPRQPDAIKIIKIGADHCASNESECTASERISQIYNADIFEQNDPLFWLVFNFLVGVFASLLSCFAMHAKKHGINNAWRDLVFNWPIPYWMRFVPKHEQDL
jgi:RsiW-degrading membrane proteinase PrsW (M82 family)